MHDLHPSSTTAAGIAPSGASSAIVSPGTVLVGPRRPIRARVGLVVGPVAVAVSVVFLTLASVSTPTHAQVAPTSAPSAGAPPTTAPRTQDGTAPPIGDDPSANTWAVSPTGGDATNPAERSNFSYDVAPGSTIQDKVTLWNNGNFERTFDIYARDAYNTDNGGIDLLTKEQGSKDLGSWVKLERELVTIPPHKGLVIPFTLTVPADAVPGDHDAGIVASLATSTGAAQNTGVSVEHRVGVRMYTRVTGPLTPALVIEDVDSSYHGGNGFSGGGGVDVTYTVRNTGNVRLKAHQTLSASGLLGWPLAERTPPDVNELLPGAEAAYTQHFDDIALAGRVTTDITITPFAPSVSEKGLPPLEPTTRSTSTWAVPWKLLLALAVVLGAWWGRRRWKARGAAGRGGGDADQPVEPGPTEGDEGAAAEDTHPGDGAADTTADIVLAGPADREPEAVSPSSSP
jgi:hypothetical protein